MICNRIAKFGADVNRSYHEAISHDDHERNEEKNGEEGEGRRVRPRDVRDKGVALGRVHAPSHTRGPLQGVRSCKNSNRLKQPKGQHCPD